MNSDDLEWVTNRYIGEIMVLESETGIIDTVKIWDIHIHNCISPYNMNIDYWVDEYIARASIDYLFTGSNSIDGYFYIIKEKNNEPVYVGNGINHKWSKSMKYNHESIEIFGKIYNDVIFLIINIINQKTQHRMKILLNFLYGVKNTVFFSIPMNTE